MRNKVFVVEGIHDQSRLLQIDSNLNIVVTNGSEISKETISLLKKLDETHDLILVLDPDHAGERIRTILMKELVNCYHIFIDQKKAISKNKRKVGVEHVEIEDLKKSISSMYDKKPNKSDVTISFLYDNGLIGQKDSQEKRTILSEYFKIGKTNGKTLLRRLVMFGINKKDITEALNEASS